ncbi:MAG: secondary thiamine-phosphate synthase enzyme YjbQ [Actinomycetota bacterium]
MQEFSVSTTGRTELIDITAHVQEAVAASGASDGACTVFIPHTTAGVTINERADPAVKRDILAELNKVIPFDDNYAHMEGNAAAHIKATLTGSSATVLVEKGQLVLGTWQAIYFCEFDGPRNRRVLVYV